MTALPSLREIAARLGGEVSGKSVRAPGPNHSPQDRSLVITPNPTAPDGFLAHSHSGDNDLECKDFARKKIGLPDWKPSGNGPAMSPDIIHDYVTEDGELLFQVLRKPNKQFPQRRPDGKGGWIWQVRDVRRVPYRLPELVKSGDAPVLIPGGEKDVDNLRNLGFTATCNAGGEGNWQDELSQWFSGRRVFILCDNDAKGERHQAVIGEALTGIASEVRVVRFPELAEKGDVSNFIEQRKRDGLDVAAIRKELAERFKAAPEWTASTASISVSTAEKREDTWRVPLPLPEGLSPVAALDTALLPATIAPWVSDISERMQCPPDFVGMTALVALGSVLGRKIGIAPEMQTDWFEVPNLWGCAVGRPGVMKTPAIGEALKPLHRLEVTARETYDTEAAEYAKTLQLWKMRKEAAEGTFKSALKKDAGASLVFADPQPTEPIERRYVTNDTTYEKLGEILAQNPNGVLAHRDELVSLLKTLDREEFAAARGFFLTAWNGKERYTFDRIGRGRVHIEGACLSMIGSTQPGRIAEYVRRAVSGGAGDDGLIQRFGLLIWPDQSPEWKSVDRYPDTAARNVAWETFDSFDRLTPEAVSAEMLPYQTVPILRLDTVAHGLFLEWRSDLERRLRAADMHPAFESHLAKYRKLVPVLALINHLADGGIGPVNENALLRALGLAEYLETHACRTYGAGPEAEYAAAKAVLTRIRKGHLVDGFTLRDVCRQQWSHLTDRDQALSGLHLLCDLDWIAAEDTSTGGRPTIRYTINPRSRQ